MDYASQWPQGIINGVVSTPSSSSKDHQTLEKRAVKAQKGQQQQQQQQQQQDQGIINCPRCNSTNTKFCYYNNYSLSQPRYFCKTCRRYWTQGGSLRNVPVGGGSRKNKRSSSSSSSSKKTVIDADQVNGGLIQSHNPQNPNSSIQGHDLNLAYGTNLPLLPQNPSLITSSELSLGNFMGLSSFPPPPGSVDPIGNVYSSSGRFFSSLQDLKPTLHYFSLDNGNNNGSTNGFGSGNNNGSAQERGNARSGGDHGDDGLIYEHDDGRGHGDHSPSGYNWNGSGMFGGGGGGSWQL